MLGGGMVLVGVSVSQGDGGVREGRGAALFTLSSGMPLGWAG